MKCISCSVEINPQWKHAIDINVCPFCGKEIMEEHLKNLFSALRSTMEELSKYPNQLNDWMLSNHGFIKTDSKDLSSYLPKQNEEIKIIEKETSDKGGEEGVIPSKKIQSDERTNLFFTRAEAVKPGIDGFKSVSEKTEHIKNMVRKIKEEGSSSINENGETSILSPEMMEVSDPDTITALQVLMNDNESISSALPDVNNGDDDIPAVVTAMANRAKGVAGNNTKDLMRLQQMVSKAQGKGNGGFFSRSGS